jgi:hypothetical protein
MSSFAYTVVNIITVWVLALIKYDVTKFECKPHDDNKDNLGVTPRPRTSNNEDYWFLVIVFFLNYIFEIKAASLFELLNLNFC